MMRATTKVLLALFCVAAVGCAAAREEQQRAASAPTANVAGQWSGQAGTAGTFVPISLSLSQNGTKVTGNAMIAGRPDLSGPVTGDVQGELLRLQAATATSSTLRVQGDTITGQSSLWGPVTLRRSQ
jgi:hypothetical protein